MNGHSNNSKELSDLEPCTEGTTDLAFYILRLEDIRWYVYTGVHVLFALGLAGNIISLLAFYRNSKKGSAYWSQLAIIVSDVLTMFATFVGNVGDTYFRVFHNLGPKFVQESWFLLSIFGSWCWVVQSGGRVATILIMMGACIERILSLFSPVLFSTWNHKRRTIITFAISYVVGLVIGARFHLTFSVVADKRFGYVVYIDQSSGSLLIVQILNSLQQAVTYGGVIILGIMTVIILVKYRLVMQKKKTQTSSRTAGNDDSGPVDEATLTLLLLCQLGMAILGNGTQNVYLYSVFVMHVPWCTRIAVALEITKEVFQGIQLSGNFLIYVGMSKKFRKAVLSVLRRFRGQSGETSIVQPVKQQANGAQKDNGKLRMLNKVEPAT